MRRLFRCEARRSKRSYEGRRAVAFGIRFGYWPCLRAPFLQVAFLSWRVDLWHGYPSRTMVARGDA